MGVRRAPHQLWAWLQWEQAGERQQVEGPAVDHKPNGAATGPGEAVPSRRGGPGSGHRSPWRGHHAPAGLLTHDQLRAASKRSRAATSRSAWRCQSADSSSKSDDSAGAQGNRVKTQQREEPDQAASARAPSTSQVGQLVDAAAVKGQAAAARPDPGLEGVLWPSYRTGQTAGGARCSAQRSLPLRLAPCHQRQAGRLGRAWIAPQPPPFHVARVATEEGDTRLR